MSDTPKLPSEELNMVLANNPLVSTDWLLGQLTLFGKPVLMVGYSGWWCWLDLHSALPGLKSQIGSEANHTTPNAATRQCAERLASAIAGTTIKQDAERLNEALKTVP